MRPMSAILALSAALVPAAAGVPPQFVEVSAAAGIAHLHHTPVAPGSCIFESCEPERMAGAAAVGDVDGDGDLDLFMTTLYSDDRLFLNDGDGTFTDATGASGISGGQQSNGAGFADLDNDGDLDLYVTTLESGPPLPHAGFAAWINDGSGFFAEEGVARGLAQQAGIAHRGFSVAFGDYDRDGWVDVHTTEWNSTTTPSHARLLRNLGAGGQPGVFSDVTTAAGVDLSFLFSFASALVDLDGDGWSDLAVASDFETSRLFWNNGNGTFREDTVGAGVGTDENGMGSTFGDVDGDGLLDWFVTSIYESTPSCPSCNWGTTGNRLYRNRGDRTFEDWTDAAGVRDGAWGWGAAFFDFDNDRDLDLVMTNGMDVQGSASEDAFNANPMRMWENDGNGVMTEISSAVGMTDTGSGKGLVVFDYDDDGDLDVLIVNNGGLPALYRNDGGNVNGWLRVRPVGSVSNRDGFGARVELHEGGGRPPQLRLIGASTHFLGQSERVAHFGVGQGSAPIERVVVSWPSGLRQGWDALPRDTTLVADEASCVDADGDLHCGTLDCDDVEPAVHVGAGESNDGLDNQCPGEVGHGVADEVAGLAFSVPGDPTTIGWSAQPGASGYEVRRSGSPRFDDGGCVGGTTTSTVWADAASPAPGALFHYLVRATEPFAGSWGVRSDSGERTGICQ